MDTWIYGCVDLYIRWLGLTGGERAAALAPRTPSARIFMRAPPLKLFMDLMDIARAPGLGC